MHTEMTVIWVLQVIARVCYEKDEGVAVKSSVVASGVTISCRD